MTRKLCPLFVLLLLLLPFNLLTSCGSNSSNSKSSGTTISLSASGSSNGSITLNQGQTVSIVANVSGNGGVQWSLAGVGSLTNQTTTSVTYVAPTSGSTAATATVTATSTTDPSKSSSLQITVNAAISVSLSPSTPQSICVDQTIAVSATVNNDPKNAGVTWSLTGPDPSKVGSLSNQTTTSAVYNTATGFFSQDKYLPTYSATVTGTSVTDPTKSAALAVTIAPLRSYDTPLPAATFTQPYSVALPTTGPCGKPPYTWYAYGLPPGLSVNGNGISGIPTYPGSPFPSLINIVIVDSQTPTPNIAYSNQQSIVVNLPTVLTVLSGPLPATSVNATYNQTLVATAGTPPYSWSIAGGSLPAGLAIYSSTGAITGVPAVSGTSNFTVKVIDSATPVANTAVSSLSIPVNPQLAVTTTSLPSASVGTAYAQSLQATGGVPPYYFSLGSGSTLPPGLSLASVIAGVPTTVGTTNFTAAVFDSQGTTATQNLSITVDPASCANNSSLQGNYAFLLSGPVSSGLNLNFVGSFVADGAGNITQGYVDDGVTTSPSNLTGTYCMRSANLGTLTLTGLQISDYAPPASATFEVALQANGNGYAVIYENQMSLFSGQILRQDTTAFNTNKITGNYAFSFVGGDNGATVTTHAGVFTTDGAGNVTGGESDLNESTTTPTNLPTLTSNNLVVATTGRGSMTLNLGSSGTTNVVFYVVSDTQLLALETGTAVQVAPVVTGQILQQASGNYDAGSLSGASIIGLQWRDLTFVGNLGPVAEVGRLTWDGNGNLQLNADENDLGSMTSPAYSGTYSVAPNGRVTLSAGGELNSAIIYLTGPNQGFVVGPGEDVSYGAVFNQSGSPFTNLAGTFLGGNWQFSDSSTTVAVDDFSFDGSGNLSGTIYSDSSITPPGGPASNSVTATYSVSSNGRGTITENGSVTGIFYMISPTEALLLPNQDPSPIVSTLSQ